MILMLMNIIPPWELFDVTLQVKFTNAIRPFGMKTELLPSCGTMLAGTVALGLGLVLFANR